MAWIVAAVVLTWLVLMPVHFRAKALSNRPLSLASKAAPTLFSAAFAAYASFAPKGGSPYAPLIFAGLSVCALADVALEVRFEVGGTLFFLGHMLYIAALALRRTLSWWCLAVFLVALAALWLFLARYRAQAPKRHIVLGLAIYAAALAALLGFSLPLPFLAPSRSALLAALGAALFVASDLTLCHNTLRNKPVSWRYFSLGTYYMGQLLLALSAFPNP